MEFWVNWKTSEESGKEECIERESSPSLSAQFTHCHIQYIHCMHVRFMYNHTIKRQTAWPLKQLFHLYDLNPGSRFYYSKYSQTENRLFFLLKVWFKTKTKQKSLPLQSLGLGSALEQTSTELLACTHGGVTAFRFQAMLTGRKLSSLQCF